MALTAAREIALFQILEVPYSTTANYLLAGGLTVERRDATSATWQAKALILAHLASDIYQTAAIQTVLENLLDDWIDLGTDTTSIDQGAVGNIQGISIHPDNDRAEIRKQVITLVPFFRAHDDIQRSNSAFCPIYH